MKTSLKILTMLAFVVPNEAGARKQVSPATQDQAPKIEVAFVLDTTGSMGGLLQGAKDKIWSIVKELSSAEPRPEIRVGLVAYRDRSDQYVTRVKELTGDLDAMYETLTGFRAGGGGDHPEDVLSGLNEGVSKLGWSDEKGVLRVLYLVGDAPPHLEYQDVPGYPETVALARKKGIFVNAIRCGANAKTETVWRDIAKLGDGFFFSIQQSGGVRVIETPFDADISRLRGELEKTYIPYGARREAVRRKRMRVGAALKSAAPSASADRAAFLVSEEEAGRGYASAGGGSGF